MIVALFVVPPSGGIYASFRLKAVLQTGLLVFAAVNLAASALFLINVLAPTLLHLPFHHCAYDLIPDAPEGVVAAALHLTATSAVGWLVVAEWLGAGAESRVLAADLSRVAIWSYATSLLMATVGLVLA